MGRAEGKREGFAKLLNVQPREGAAGAEIRRYEAEKEREIQMAMSHGERSADSARPEPRVSSPEDKVGRNDPCPCGSGKKYKKCHGR